jgi:hypothetical protein
LLLQLAAAANARAFLRKLLDVITTGERWDKKPESTLNAGFTFGGLEQLELPRATLPSFPLEFQEGMRARADILGDCGRNDPKNWDPVWRETGVHMWLAVYGQSVAALNGRCDEMRAWMDG